MGTFVEVKNSVVGRGAKVPHLAYVGDADIGDETNIGAGTITANYNGFDKHRTRVGRRVQIGSNTVLVAPVEVGDDAYTGAGSAITRNVSKGALGIERSTQREIPGYAERRRARHERAEDGTRKPQAFHALHRFGQPGAGKRCRRGVGVRLGKVELSQFANTEVYARPLESVRGADCFVIQSHAPEINFHIMEQLILIEALRRASAHRITAVVPFFGYARADKKVLPREPISARLMSDLFLAAGADRIVSIDLHTGQIQGFFPKPLDHLTALPIVTEYLKDRLDGPTTIVSPDAGGVKRQRSMPGIWALS